MLPFSSNAKGGASFGDSLFTAVSSVCVTGLVVQDTATYWSSFGQAVILILIQIGGMGIITVAAAFSLLAGKRIGLVQRSTMQEAISAPNVGGIVRLTGFILKLIFAFELLGAAIMAPIFCKDFGIAKGIWYSVFHSVSAFCNAGFDLMGSKGKYSSLTYYSENPIIIITVVMLILIGGIGFLTWDDIRKNKFSFRKYRMQSKVILVFSAFIIVLPFLYFFFFEFEEMSVGNRILASMFQAVTPRTAGFNTVDASELSETGNALVIILMLIGGAPGSTAGGMKITTVAILLSCAASVFGHRDDSHYFGRRISHSVERSAVTVASMYLMLMTVGALIISRLENVSVLASFYETASAICTVGLTTGITPMLGTLSKCILIVLMFTGRVGGLTLVFAAFTNNSARSVKLPQEHITAG